MPLDALSWPSTRELRGFLTNLQLLVRITDKKLGIAVVQLLWYREKCPVHLLSDNFVEVNEKDISPNRLKTQVGRRQAPGHE